MKGFIVGIVVTIGALFVGGWLFLSGGGLPAGQDVAPGSVEKFLARTMLRASIRRQTAGLADPLPANEENLSAGATLYVRLCQTCHGGPDGAASTTAKGLTPYPPQLAKDGVEDDPEPVTYWKVSHGIRFTGMPRFGRTLSEREVWQVTLFLKHMDSLPAGVRDTWVAASGPRPAPARATH